MEENYSIKTLIKYIIIIVIILVAFYALTVFVTNNKDNKKEQQTSQDTVIDYDMILANAILTQPQDSYYVFAYKSDDKNVADYKSNLVAYSDKDNSLKVYYVDLDSAFNKKNLGSTSNFIDSITFSTTTLLKIENKNIVNVYENDQIDNILKTLVNE